MIEFYIEEILINCDEFPVVQVDVGFMLEGDDQVRHLSLMEDGTIINASCPNDDETPIAMLTPKDLREIADGIEKTIARCDQVYLMAKALNPTIQARLLPITPAEAAERG